MPAPVPPNPPPPRPAVPRMPTRLESADEIRAAIQSRQAELLGGAPLAPSVEAPTLPPASRPVAYAPGSPIDPSAAARAPGSPVPLFRPSNRPPVAILFVLDDGDDNGQRIRLRGDRFVIGRTEGDLVVPHDPLISSRHAELLRQQDEDGWHWQLADLGSTNGTFVRAGGAVLKDGQEFLVGRTRYRFDSGRTVAADTAPVSVASGGGTIAWNKPGDQWNTRCDPLRMPALVELTPAGPGARLPLLKMEFWIGSDAAACAVVPANDPFVNPRHAKLARDAKGRWHITNNKSVNGVWLRIDQQPLTSTCQFQLGEQRFLLRVPGP